MCTDTAEPSVKVVLSKSTCGDALAGPGEVTEWGGWPARPQPPSSEISSFHPQPPHRRPSLFSSTTKIAQLCTVQLLLVALLKHSPCYYPVGGRHYRFYRHLWSDESDFYLTDSIKHLVLCYSKVDHVRVPDRERGGGGEKTLYSTNILILVCIWKMCFNLGLG